MPRFFAISYESGCINTQLILHNAVEHNVMSDRPGIPSGFLVMCTRATWITTYSNGIQVHATGPLTCKVEKVLFRPTAESNPSLVLKMTAFEFEMESHFETVSRSSILTKVVEQLVPVGNIKNENDPDVKDIEPSPKVRKANLKRKGGPGSADSTSKKDAQDSKSSQELKDSKKDDVKPPPFPIVDGPDGQKYYSVKYEQSIVPQSHIGPYGITDRAMRCLEVCEAGLKVDVPRSTPC